VSMMRPAFLSLMASYDVTSSIWQALVRGLVLPRLAATAASSSGGNSWRTAGGRDVRVLNISSISQTSAVVGRCSLTESKPVLKALTVSALEATIYDFSA